MEQGSFPGTDGMVGTVLDRAEELLVVGAEAISERPVAAAAVGAALVGGFVGFQLGGMGRRRAPTPPTLDTGDLVEQALGLLGSLAISERVSDLGERTRGRAQQQVRRRTGGGPSLGMAGAAVGLVPLAMRLMSNPLVRRIVIGALIARMRPGRR